MSWWKQETKCCEERKVKRVVTPHPIYKIGDIFVLITRWFHPNVGDKFELVKIEEPCLKNILEWRYYLKNLQTGEIDDGRSLEAGSKKLESELTDEDKALIEGTKNFKVEFRIYQKPSTEQYFIVWKSNYPGYTDWTQLGYRKPIKGQYDGYNYEQSYEYKPWFFDFKDGAMKVLDMVKSIKQIVTLTDFKVSFIDLCEIEGRRIL